MCVSEEFNRNSPHNRRRQPKQCKDHWGKSNKTVALFNGIWCRLRDAHESGQSDDRSRRRPMPCTNRKQTSVSRLSIGGKRCVSNQSGPETITRVRKRRKIRLIWKLQEKLIRWGQSPQKQKQPCLILICHTMIFKCIMKRRPYELEPQRRRPTCSSDFLKKS